jgi:hypothetical protein
MLPLSEWGVYKSTTFLGNRYVLLANGRVVKEPYITVYHIGYLGINKTKDNQVISAIISKASIDQAQR